MQSKNNRPTHYPGCMAPDGAEPCPQYTALLERIEELEEFIKAVVPDGTYEYPITKGEQ